MRLKFLFIIVLVFFLMGCAPKEFLFKEYDVLLKSNIKEKHKIKKEKYFKFKQSINTKSWNELELEYFAEVKFLDKKNKSYNFDISLTSYSVSEYNLGGSDTIYLINNNVKMTKLFDEERELKHVFYESERKIKDGFLRFSCYTKDSIDINFLYQKFNEIEIIEK